MQVFFSGKQGLKQFDHREVRPRSKGFNRICFPGKGVKGLQGYRLMRGTAVTGSQSLPPRRPERPSSVSRPGRTGLRSPTRNKKPELDHSSLQPETWNQKLETLLFNQKPGTRNLKLFSSTRNLEPET
jgi:hypothetical protein